MAKSVRDAMTEDPLTRSFTYAVVLRMRSRPTSTPGGAAR